MVPLFKTEVAAIQKHNAGYANHKVAAQSQTLIPTTDAGALQQWRAKQLSRVINAVNRSCSGEAAVDFWPIDETLDLRGPPQAVTPLCFIGSEESAGHCT